MDYSRLMKLNTGNDILAQNNRYGYRLNINHPIVFQLYTRYRKWLKIPDHTGFPLSDNERFDFEDKAIEKLIKDKILNY